MAGMIYIIGMGPGDRNMMTDEAFSAMKKSDIIVGYTVYVDLVKSILRIKNSLLLQCGWK